VTSDERDVATMLSAVGSREYGNSSGCTFQPIKSSQHIIQASKVAVYCTFAVACMLQYGILRLSITGEIIVISQRKSTMSHFLGFECNNIRAAIMQHLKANKTHQYKEARGTVKLRQLVVFQTWELGTFVCICKFILSHQQFSLNIQLNLFDCYFVFVYYLHYNGIIEDWLS
jgi:hypothetical protein